MWESPHLVAAESVLRLRLYKRREENECNEFVEQELQKVSGMWADHRTSSAKWVASSLELLNVNGSNF